MHPLVYALRAACTAVLVVALVLFVIAPSAAAAPAGQQAANTPPPPIDFTADQVTYDSERGIMRASGNVEAVRQDTQLFAETIIYDQPNNLMTAVGNVVIAEPTGETLFGDRVELTGDLKSGIAENFRAILSDGARMSAQRGHLKDGNRTIARQGAYTPCEVCNENPARPPLWQIRAAKVVHDREKKVVTLNDAWLEVGGLPVGYTPYLSLPDPTVKRKSGFLVPGFGSSSDFGPFVQTPYFWNISPSEDATITPWWRFQDPPILQGEYRRDLEHGAIAGTGSLTGDSDKAVRGHIFGAARYDIDEMWRAGLDLNRASDRTYLRRYDFSDDQTLVSRLYAEAFNKQNYFVANTYAFDELSSDINQSSVPFVVPQIDFYGDYNAPFDSRVLMHTDALSLIRDDGQDTRRLSQRVQWDVPLRGNIGDIYTFSTAFWADGYQVNDFVPPGDTNHFNGFSGRAFPQAGVDWRLPLVKAGENVQQMIQPRIEFIAAPNAGNPNRIPDEDSQSFEFDETNLFGFDRFAGLDVVEPGARFNYGLEWDLFANSGASASLIVGQAYRFKQSDVFPQGSGLDENFSDYVAAVDLSPARYFDLLYRTRIDKDDFSPRRHELGSRIGVDAISLDTRYVYFTPTDEFNKGREEVSFALRTQWTRYWASQIYGIRDLTGGGVWRRAGIRLLYEDECLEASAEFRRKDYRERDLQPSNAFIIRIGLKTLGAIGGGFKP
jgi:LPS-assembly protein